MPLQAPPPAVWQPLEGLAPGIYRAFLGRLVAGVAGRGVVATSWYRGTRENRDVGGAPTSQHLLGLAVDLQTRDTAGVAASLNAVGLISVDEGSHVHAQLFPPHSVAPLVSFLAQP